MKTSQFTSQRLSKTGVITLQAPVKNVFPLFGPIREKDWADGWNPNIIYSTTNLVEEHMVFTTKPHHKRHGEPDSLWIISKYLPEQAFIEYTVFRPERVWWITIQCYEDIPNQTTRAEITYTLTGLSDMGNTINEKFLQRMYAHDLKDWEEAINYYLKTGETQTHH